MVFRPADAPVVVFLIGVAVSLLASVATPQSAGPATFPTFYFDTLGYTETWLDLTPPPAAGDAASPVSLNITVRYPGRPVEGPLAARPLAIVIRAESNPQYNPAFIRQPILMFEADGEPLWDPALRVNFYARHAPPCDGCSTSADIVDVVVPEDVVRRMGAATRLSGRAFGMPFALSAGQIDRIRAFVDAVLGAP